MSALAQPKRTLALQSCTPRRHGPQNICKCWADICAATPAPLHQKAAQREYGESGLWYRLALGRCVSFLHAPCLSVFSCIKWGDDNNTSHRAVWWLNKSVHVKFSVQGQVGRKYPIILGPKPFLPDRKATASLPMVCSAASHSSLLLAIPLQLCGIFLQNTTQSVHLPSLVLPCYVSYIHSPSQIVKPTRAENCVPALFTEILGSNVGTSQGTEWGGVESILYKYQRAGFQAEMETGAKEGG